MRILNTALALALMATSSWSSDLSEEFKWTRTFVLSSKGVVAGSVTHNLDGVQLQFGGMNMKMGGYNFSRGSTLNGIVAIADGALKVEQSVSDFRANILKLGATILSEK